MTAALSPLYQTYVFAAFRKLQSRPPIIPHQGKRYGPPAPEMPIPVERWQDRRRRHLRMLANAMQRMVKPAAIARRFVDLGRGRTVRF